MAITGIDTIEGKQIIAAGAVSSKSAEMAYKDENGNPITGYQVAGDYYSASNPSGFITGVDLTPYQLTADMTAYQPAGDYMTTADSANFYTTANESGFISEVPAGTMNESAFSYDASDNITAYNGSAFAGGSDVPEGVMVESGLEYNAVNEISAYNGSAIAQYGAEKQWLVHDDTLVHAANSAQYALGVNLSAVAQLLGVDETVLWSGEAYSGNLNLTESKNNFTKLAFEISEATGYNRINYANASAAYFDNSFITHYPDQKRQLILKYSQLSATNETTLNIFNYGRIVYSTAANDIASASNNTVKYLKIVGIGRKQ